MARGSSDVGVARRSRTHGGGPAHLSHWLRPALPSRPAAQLRAPRGPGRPCTPSTSSRPSAWGCSVGFAARRVAAHRERDRGTWGKASHQEPPRHDSTCRKVRKGCFWNTGQCRLSVETPEQRGCLGPLGGLKGHAGHLRPAPPPLHRLGVQTPRLPGDPFLPRPGRSCAQRGLLYRAAASRRCGRGRTWAVPCGHRSRMWAAPRRGHRARDVSSPPGPWATAQDLSEAGCRVSHWLVCLSWASCPVAGLACRRAAPWSCPLSPLGPAGGQPRLHRQGPEGLIRPGPASPLPL